MWSVLTSAVIDSVGGLSNSASGSAATGSLTFTQQPADGEVLLLEANNTGTTITFKNVVTNAATRIQIGATLGLPGPLRGRKDEVQRADRLTTQLKFHRCQ